MMYDLQQVTSFADRMWSNEGYVYFNKTKKTSLVNAQHPVQDIYRCLRQLGFDGIADGTENKVDIPYESVEDYVATLQATSCPGTDSCFE